MRIKIRSWINGKVLYAIEADSIKLAVEALVRQGANLMDAQLGGAQLVGAQLVGAQLGGAQLGGANLRGANLRGAKIDDLLCLCELSDAIDLAPMIFQEWQDSGFEDAKARFGLYQVSGENNALIAMVPLLLGGFCFVLHRREIWWWNWSCPDPETVPVLWREAKE